MFRSLGLPLRGVVGGHRSRWVWPLVLAVLVATVAGLGGSWGVASGQTVPPPRIGVQAGPALAGTVGTSGGKLSSADGRTQLTVLADSLQGTMNVAMIPLDTSSLPGLPGGLSSGVLAFDLTVTDPVTGQLQTQFDPPLLVTYVPTPEELAAVGGDPSLITMVFWNGSDWVAVPGTVNPDGSITFVISHTTIFRVVLVNKDARVGQVLDVPGGRFFTATNGFGGATGTGFAVTDDESAAFFTEFQRLGGENRVGLPVGGRFLFKGFITQPFQKMALQWRPELQQAVPVNVFDELTQLGVDAYLDSYAQVPPAQDTSQDTGLPFDQVIARHLAFLDPYPALRDAYNSDPNALETFGLPLAVKDYGPFVTARLQRATMQLWKVDVPWATAGTVILGNGSDLAKQVGLWPVGAITPQKPR